MITRQTKWPWLVTASFCAMLSLTAPQGFSEAAQESDGKRLVEQIQGVFMDLADRVKPAVVNIAPVSTTLGSGEDPRERNPNSAGMAYGDNVDKRDQIITNTHVEGDR